MSGLLLAYFCQHSSVAQHALSGALLVAVCHLSADIIQGHVLFLATERQNFATLHQICIWLYVNMWQQKSATIGKTWWDRPDLGAYAGRSLVIRLANQQQAFI